MQQHFALQEPIGVVESQQCRRRLTDFGDTYDAGAIEPKMLGPTVGTGVEQSAKLSGAF